VPSVVVSLLHSLRFIVGSRAALHLEIIALRHQLTAVNRSAESLPPTNETAGQRLRHRPPKVTFPEWITRIAPARREKDLDSPHVTAIACAPPAVMAEFRGRAGQ
jgi:hypothetical protein